MSGSDLGPYLPVALIVLDGWGEADGPRASGCDAIREARTPNLDAWRASAPFALLGASGEDVGLKPGQMGDSNVGHLNLGAGRVVYQDVVRIDGAIRDGSLAGNPVITGLFDAVKSNGTALHLLGLLSDGGVHSHLDHLQCLLAMARGAGVGRLRLHAFLDGRDVPPRSAVSYLEIIERELAAAGAGLDHRLASMAGRYYAMDRDRRWERTEQAYRAICGLGGRTAGHWREALDRAYSLGESDEFVTPVRFEPQEPVSRGDALFFFNFRADRGRQLIRAFAEGAGFSGFVRPGGPPDVRLATMTRYDASLPLAAAFGPLELVNTLGEVVSGAGMGQLRLAETEKFAHVTFFFSGRREEPFAGEERILVPSPKVPTYDLQPEMSAPEVSEQAVRAVQAGRFGLIILNYANGDMVGHTGKWAAAVRAAEAVDAGLGRVVPAVLAQGGAAFIVADHGNAEEMHDHAGNCPHTAHTCNPVPALLVADKLPAGAGLRAGILADVAPTVLHLMGIRQPREMTGRSLLCAVRGADGTQA
ncbi:MAG: 2,3-bisphosphoglycerate-independent phosphoglycerate mutase [Bacillota bacterium]|nr:2,3-bisphosphoglycerate-independent phosphoglycerate mutase [Bacillota bacterium]